ncbi:hypothetical protein C2G38_2181202 [Gigaspora rosea]|uniref:Uncharacterized protein n=1 Tax=Gigaspora rosea TaxID=44941 RepID=A0A397VCC7_9GLOM|nr:hypothetical protein C2G38_2181202 [Gigaspora rosea]
MRWTLTKITWIKGGKLCHKCYMNCVENLLKRGAKRLKDSVEEVEVTTREEVTKKDVGTITEDLEIIDEEVSMIHLVKTIEAMTRVFYEREHVKKEGSIYSYNELREVFQTNKSVKNFLDQLYLIARPLERNKQTMDRMKKLIVHICYLLASLNNTKINSFKFDVAYYLDSAENVLLKYSEKAFMLNIDDYHNIHVPRQSDSTSTSIPVHITTILAIPCSISSVPHNRALNPKIVDDKLIKRHPNERFIINLGIPYHERSRNYIDYTRAIRIVHDQEPMQEYLENYVIPVVADWPGQFFIRKAIAHRILLNNEIISSFITSKNYKRAPLMFFSDIFYWMEISHPMIDMITTYLASLSDLLVEIAHSIIRQRTPKFFIADQLQKEACYEITDRHLPRGFVTSRKPFTTILCDYFIAVVLTIAEIKKIINAIKESIMNKLGENEFIDERSEDMAEDNSDADAATDDTTTTANLFENAKQLFLQL